MHCHGGQCDSHPRQHHKSKTKPHLTFPVGWGSFVVSDGLHAGEDLSLLRVELLLREDALNTERVERLQLLGGVGPVGAVTTEVG